MAAISSRLRSRTSAAPSAALDDVNFDRPAHLQAWRRCGSCDRALRLRHLQPSDFNVDRPAPLMRVLLSCLLRGNDHSSTQLRRYCLSAVEIEREVCARCAGPRCTYPCAPIRCTRTLHAHVELHGSPLCSGHYSIGCSGCALSGVHCKETTGTHRERGERAASEAANRGGVAAAFVLAAACERQQRRERLNRQNSRPKRSTLPIRRLEPVWCCCTRF